ncbi:MAG: DUF4304 domain-containing protein [Bacteroidetes bacterium]|nr:DUF4304 domain-containing protein [Bacteroidota bacterium]
MTDRDFKSEFDSIIKEVIAPIFKANGFKKNGNNFYRDLGEVGQAFNVQQSQWNSKDDKTFVFNLGLLDKEIQNIVYQRELPKFPKEYDCEIRLRHGQLLNKGDIWYDLNKRTDLEKLKIQIIKDVENYVLPFLDKYQDPNKWIEFFDWKFEPITGPIEKFLIIEKYGERARAEKFWNDLYNEALFPKPQVSEIRTKDGQVIRDESEPTVNREWIKRLEDFAEKKEVKLEIRPTTTPVSKRADSDKRNDNTIKKLWSMLKGK